MSKTSFREQIDLEMKDVRLSAERIRRIHGQTDRKRARRRAGHRALPRRFPAALLSLALTACAVLAFVNRANIAQLFSPRVDILVSRPDPLAGGNADSGVVETPAPTERPEREITFEAAGVTFTLESAAAEADMLTLNWRVTSERDDQVCFAFYDFRIDGCECHATPYEFNGLDGLAALGGTVEGVALPTKRSFANAIPIVATGDTLTVHMVMAVYAPAAEPRLEISDPDFLPTASPYMTPEPTPSGAETKTNFAGSAASGVITDAPPSSLEEELEQLRLKMELTAAAGALEEAWALVDEMRYINSVDALEDGQLSLLEEGVISPAYLQAMKTEITSEIDRDGSLSGARASLALASQCGVIALLEETAIDIDLRLILNSV